MEKKLKNAIIMNRLTKIMFVLGFLLTSVWSYSSNSVYAQNQKFSFEFKQTSIKTIFQYIEKHSEFIFMYRTDLLDTSKKVSVKVEKQSIEQILEQVLKGTSVVYEINDLRSGNNNGAMGISRTRGRMSRCMAPMPSPS